MNDENFDRYIKDTERTALVLFHAKWCKKCVYLMENMRNAARKFKVCTLFSIPFLPEYRKSLDWKQTLSFEKPEKKNERAEFI